jgi:hypothetical protein
MTLILPHGRPSACPTILRTMGDLRGADDDDAPIGLHVGIGAVVFQVAVLHDAGFVFTFEDVRRLFELLVHLAEMDTKRADDIAGRVFVDQGRALLHGRFRIQHMRKDVIVDLDQFQRSFRGQHVRGHHGGDGVPDEPGLVGEDQTIRDVAVPGFQSPWVAGRGELEARKVAMTDHRLDPRQKQRGARINVSYHGMGMRTAQRLADQHVAFEEIIGEPGLAGDFSHGIQSWYTLPDDPISHDGLPS